MATEHQHDPAATPLRPRYLSKKELVRVTGLSPATVQRLKDAGAIPFFQPAGPGGKLLFPPDAIEVARLQAAAAEPLASIVSDASDVTSSRNVGGLTLPQLPGPRPRWQRTPSENQRYNL